MKTLKNLLMVVLAVMAFAMPASAQLRFGVKAGVDVTSLDVKGSDYEKNNATGYTAGVMVDFTVPLIGIGVDASLMYTRRSTPQNLYLVAPEGVAIIGAEMTDKNYIEVPVNLKYALSLPVVSNIVKPFIATGPSIAFNLSDKVKDTNLDIKKANMSWNLGAGLELVKHLQVGFNYRWGLGSVNKKKTEWEETFDLKTKGWSITAAYLF